MPRVAVVGGGIVGLATGFALLQQRPDLNLRLFEKETSFGLHQTGRNSGVLHSGIYYPAGSAKLRMCRSGREQLIRLCSDWGIPLRRTGKLIVPTAPEELPKLHSLHQRARANGIRCELLDGDAARELVPRLKAREALLVQETGLVDFGQIAGRLGSHLRRAGVRFEMGTQVHSFRSEKGGGVRLHSKRSTEEVDFAVNCAGLHADSLARRSGLQLDLRLIPFRGDYYRLLPPAAEGLERLPIYPIPDPRFPFLGIHLTPNLAGDVTAGPSASLAWAREGYRRGQIDLREALTILGYPGMHTLLRRYWRVGARQWWSGGRRQFAREVSRLVDGVGPGDLTDWPGGIRAQALTKGGELVDDFVLKRAGSTLHVLNAPSPAATAALAIGEHIASKVLESL